MTPDVRPAGGDGEQGFTVVEVLVAFAVAAVGTLMALQIAGETAARLRRVATLQVEADEAEGICLRRRAAGPLQAGTQEGRFSDGRPWTLQVSDVRPALPSRRGPPLWQMRVIRGGAAGPALYTTLVADRPDG